MKITLQHDALIAADKIVANPGDYILFRGETDRDQARREAAEAIRALTGERDMSDYAMQQVGVGAFLSYPEAAQQNAKWEAERKRERAAHARRARKEQAQQRRMASLEAALRTPGLTGHDDVLTAARAYLRFLDAAPSPEEAP